MTKFQNFCPKSYTQSVKKLDFEQEGSPVPQTLLRFIPHRRLNPNTALPGHKVLDSRAIKLLLLLITALIESSDEDSAEATFQRTSLLIYPN